MTTPETIKTGEVIAYTLMALLVLHTCFSIGMGAGPFYSWIAGVLS